MRHIAVVIAAERRVNRDAWRGSDVAHGDAAIVDADHVPAGADSDTVTDRRALAADRNRLICVELEPVALSQFQRKHFDIAILIGICR